MTAASVLQRPLRASDLDEVMKWEMVLFPYDAFPRSEYERGIRSPKQRWIALEKEGKLAAWGGVALHKNVANLDSVAVSPDFQGQGLGLALTVSLMEAALDAGHKRLALQVASENTRAFELYRKLGFVKVATLGDHYGKGKDAYLMQTDMNYPELRGVFDAARAASRARVPVTSAEMQQTGSVEVS